MFYNIASGLILKFFEGVDSRDPNCETKMEAALDIFP